MKKMATEIFCASIHTLKLALAEKTRLKCIDNTNNNNNNKIITILNEVKI